MSRGSQLAALVVGSQDGERILDAVRRAGRQVDDAAPGT